jgi:hypothetical protein
MPCESVRLPGGGYAMLCKRGGKGKPCSWCARPHTLLCDYPVSPGRTCSARLCEHHATKRGGGDLCPPHLIAWNERTSPSVA